MFARCFTPSSVSGTSLSLSVSSEASAANSLTPASVMLPADTSSMLSVVNFASSFSPASLTLARRMDSVFSDLSPVKCAKPVPVTAVSSRSSDSSAVKSASAFRSASVTLEELSDRVRRDLALPTCWMPAPLTMVPSRKRQRSDFMSARCFRPSLVTLLPDRSTTSSDVKPASPAPVTVSVTRSIFKDFRPVSSCRPVSVIFVSHRISICSDFMRPRSLRSSSVKGKRTMESPKPMSGTGKALNAPGFHSLMF